MSDSVVQMPLPAAGVHPEINQNELPPTALHDAANWIFRDGRMRVRAGVETIANDTDDRPNGFLGYIDDTGIPVLLMGTDDTVFAFDDATQAWVDLSASFTAGVAENTLFEVFALGSASGPQTTVYIQNGLDLPKKWTYGDASVSAVDTGDPMPVAKAMMILGDRVILGNLIDHASSSYAGAVGPTVLTVSASQNPAAGYDGTDGLVAQLLDTPGAIVAMREIGNLQGVVYKTDAIYVASAGVENPIELSLKKAGTPGPVSERAVVVASDGLQYYLARDGNVMVFDGIEPRPLGRHIQRYVLDTWDIDTSYKAHGIYDDENRELVFFYATIGRAEPDRFIKIRLDDASLWPNTFTDLRITAAIKASLPGGTTIGQLVGDIGSQTLTLGEYDALGQSFLFGEVGGQCLRESGTLDNAGAIPAFFETGSSDLGDPLRFKSVRYVDHLFSTSAADQTVSVTLLKSDYGEDMVSDSARTLNVGAGGPYRTHHRFPSRSYAMRVEASATEAIEWQGATIVYATQGRR